MKKTSLQCRIPEKMRGEIASSKLNEKCCLENSDCYGRIQWHHNLIFAGKRVNEPFAILGVCGYHHQHESEYKEKLNAVMVSRATDEQLLPYCKAINYLKYRV